MKRKPRSSEQALAAILVTWLEAMGADVYQEVECSSGVADIVAIINAELVIIEVKTSMNLAVLVQAMARRRSAHRVYVAAPLGANAKDAIAICTELGIGLFEITTGEPGSIWNHPSVRERVKSRRWNTRPVKLRGKLSEGHKTHAKAGAVGGGGRWTPFRDTCEQLRREVRQDPGISLRDAVAAIRHHYRTPSIARASLVKWIREGTVPGVRIDAENKLFPTEP